MFIDDDGDRPEQAGERTRSSAAVPAIQIGMDSPYASPGSGSPGSDPEDSLVVPEVVPFKKSRFGLWFLAWPMLVLLIGFLVMQPFLVEEDEISEPDSYLEVSALEVQGRYVVGTAHFPQMDDAQREELYASSEQMNTGSWESRLCYAVMSGELVGAEEALTNLEGIPLAAEAAEYQPSESQARLHELLTSVYRDYSMEEWKAPSLSANDRKFLNENLGWYSELALTPEEGPNVDQRDQLVQAAQLTAVCIVLGFLAGMVVGASGLAGLTLFVVQTLRGKVVGRVERRTENSNIYIETFALWFVLFLVFSLLSQILLPPDAPLIANAFVQLCSLLALGWPLIRRVRWADFRREIGLYAEKPLTEVFWGGICYVSTLPLVGCGLVVMAVMMGIAGLFVETNEFDGVSGPTHPIGEWLGQAGWLGIVQIFILAAVIAPIVEEIMFRGVLYRHLRDLTARWRVAISVVFATLFNSLIFAAIHPQGIFGIPLLMSLAIGFSLAREWRGSLVAPMTMHAINNGVITLIAASLL